MNHQLHQENYQPSGIIPLLCGLILLAVVLLAALIVRVEYGIASYEQEERRIQENANRIYQGR